MLHFENAARWIVLAAIALIIISALGLFVSFFQKTDTTVHIGNRVVKARVADTPDKQKRGLSGVEKLNDTEGMLFVFEEPDDWGIWMKDMKIPIDIIWIDQNNQVVDIEKNVSPDTYPRVYTPDRLSKYVLEVPAGFTERAQVNYGALVTIRAGL